MNVTMPSVAHCLREGVWAPSTRRQTRNAQGSIIIRCCFQHNGDIIELRPGTVFYIPAVPHDSWVVGDEPYVSLHFLGAEKYAR